MPTRTVSREGLHAELATDMSEARLQAHIVKVARDLGWWVYHTYDSRRNRPGFPDLFLARDRILYRECKTEKGRLSAEQKRVHAQLRRAGGDVAVWRPSDYYSGLIERELR